MIDETQSLVGASEGDFWADLPTKVKHPSISVDRTAGSPVMFELSPLNRVVEQGFPGTDGQAGNGTTSLGAHTVKYEYSTNNTVAYSDLANTKRVSLYRVNILADGRRSLSISCR